MMDMGALPWTLIVVLGTVALGAAIAYGMMRANYRQSAPEKRRTGLLALVAAIGIGALVTAAALAVQSLSGPSGSQTAADQADPAVRNSREAGKGEVVAPPNENPAVDTTE